VTREAAAFADAVRRAMNLEAQHDLPGAFAAYETALALRPGAPEAVLPLAQLAFRLGEYGVSEKLYAHLLAQGPVEPGVICGYAAALREQKRFDAAIDLLKPVIAQNPAIPQLWRALGEVMAAQLDGANALIFYDEALRLAPDDPSTRMLRACQLLDNGQQEDGLKELEAVIGRFDDPDDDASAAIAHAHALLRAGRLEDGWRAYEARYRYGATQEVHYALWAPHWRPGEPLAGCNMLVCAEQGLGDEVLFASLLPDVVRDLGPDGRLTLAVEPRLVALFARSFPRARVIAHRTQRIDGLLQRSFPDFDQSSLDAWALMGDFLSVYRRDIADFPAGNVFLTPDPARVAHWKGVLDGLGPGPKVGVLWKSLKGGNLRDPAFAPFADWREILTTPGVAFVNLQYGDSTEEARRAEEWGAPMLRLPGLDPKDDLDELAAVSRALDLIVAPSNATSNIAAACGGEVWLLAPGQSWTQLGQKNYIWYPGVRTFHPPSLKDWSRPVRRLRAALIERFSAPCTG